MTLKADNIRKENLFPKYEEQFAEMTCDLPILDSGEKTANTRLANFIKHDVADYDKARDFPELDKTSHLSRYLRTGEISVRTIWQALQENEATEGRAIFEKELCWRDFYNMIYVSFPQPKKRAYPRKLSFY